MLKKGTMLIKYRSRPTDCIKIVLLFYIVCPSLAECYDSYSSKDVEILDIMVGLYDRNKLSITNYFVCKNSVILSEDRKHNFEKLTTEKYNFWLPGINWRFFRQVIILGRSRDVFLKYIDTLKT